MHTAARREEKVQEAAQYSIDIRALANNPSNWDGRSSTSIVLAAEKDHVQDFHGTLCHIEVGLREIVEEYPWLDELIMQSDNGADHHSAGFVQGCWYIAAHLNLSLIVLVMTCPGHGKGAADGLFTALKSAVRLKHRAGNDVSSGLAFMWLADQGANLPVLLHAQC